MADHLNRHLGQNLAFLEQATYVCPRSGKTRRLKDIAGSVWLKCLVVICNTAADHDREFFAGIRYLAEKAGTNIEGATEAVDLLEQIGYITPNGFRPPATGKRGRPARCWVVTLPDLPPLLQNLWREPAQKPATSPAAVVPISDQKRKQAPRSGGVSAGVGAIVGNLAQDLAAAVAAADHGTQNTAMQISRETQQAIDEARALVQAQASLNNMTERKIGLLLDQAQGSWEHRNGREQSAIDQVQEALTSGQCTLANAVQWLANGHTNSTPLLQYVTQIQG